MVPFGGAEAGKVMDSFSMTGARSGVGTPGIGSLPRVAREGRFVLCEEAARDGAQGKTLLLASQRVELFRRSAAVLGEWGDTCFVAMVGFPAIGEAEVEVIRETLANVDRGYQQLVCRGLAPELRLGVDLARRARAGRVLFVVPVSEAMAGAMLHVGAERAVERAKDLLRLALDHAAGEVAVDVCLADMGRAEPDFVAAAANQLTSEGAELIMLADTVGALHPLGHQRQLSRITAQLEPRVCIHAHFHNDQGLGLALNLAALEMGHRVFGASWLGLGERSGLGHTEELLGILATASNEQLADLGTTRECLGVDGWAPLEIVPTARWLSNELGLPRRQTDPFVGTGVNSISTGTPFVAPRIFQPFDAEGVLGVAPTVVLTHLASARVVQAVAAARGLHLEPAEVAEVQARAKARAYETGKAEVDLDEVLGPGEGR